MNALRELAEYAKGSGTSEGRLIADFVQDLMDDGTPEPEIESSIMALSEWADMFRRKVKGMKG